MQYDPIRSILAGKGDELGRLVDVSEGGAPTEAEQQQWSEAGVMVGDALHPTVRGIVEVLTRPARSVVIERFCQNVVQPLFVAWDLKGRATLTEGIPGGTTTVQATSFDLLAPLLMQALHLHRNMPAPDDRTPVTTTAGAMASLFESEPHHTDDQPGDHDDLSEVLADLRFAWRASGGRPGAEIDTSVTALSAGPLGLWTVTGSARTTGTGRPSMSPDAPVVVEPTTLAELTSLLGDVVTGRAAGVGGRDTKAGEAGAAQSASTVSR